MPEVYIINGTRYLVENGLAYPAQLEPLSFGNLFLWIALAVCISAIIITLIITEHKKNINKPDRKPSIITRTILLSMFIIFVIVIIKIMTGNTLGKWDLLLFLGIIVLVMLMNFYEPRRLKPLDENKLIEKALKCIYEIQYELNNRPEWVWIPLAGLSRLLDE